MAYEEQITFITTVTLVYIAMVGVFYSFGIQLEVDPILFVMPALFLFMGSAMLSQLKNRPVPQISN